jgi:hypothetical protein
MSLFTFPSSLSCWVDAASSAVFPGWASAGTVPCSVFSPFLSALRVAAFRAGEEVEAQAAASLTNIIFGQSWLSIARDLGYIVDAGDSITLATASPVHPGFDLPPFGAGVGAGASAGFSSAFGASPLPSASPTASYSSTPVHGIGTLAPGSDLFPPPPPEQCLTGSWVVDPARSESLEPFLRALDLPAAARKVALSLRVCNSILHTGNTLTLVDKSPVFTNRTALWLDGIARDRVGDDGKVAVLRAWRVSPSFVPPPDAPLPLDPQGRVPGTVLYVVDLPDSMGSTLEYRWRDGASMMVRSELYSAAGEIRAVVTRVWVPAEVGDPLAVQLRDEPSVTEKALPTTRITNPIGMASHATRIPAGASM